MTLPDIPDQPFRDGSGFFFRFIRLMRTSSYHNQKGCFMIYRPHFILA